MFRSHFIRRQRPLSSAARSFVSWSTTVAVLACTGAQVLADGAIDKNSRTSRSQQSEALRLLTAIQDRIDEMVEEGWDLGVATRVARGAESEKDLAARIKRYEDVRGVTALIDDFEESEGLINRLLADNTEENFAEVSRDAVISGVNLPANARRAGLDGRGIMKFLGKNEWQGGEAEHEPGTWEKIRRNGADTFLRRSYLKNRGRDKNMADNMSWTDVLGIDGQCEFLGASLEDCDKFIATFDKRRERDGKASLEDFIGDMNRFQLGRLGFDIYNGGLRWPRTGGLRVGFDLRPFGDRWAHRIRLAKFAA